MILKDYKNVENYYFLKYKYMNLLKFVYHLHNVMILQCNKKWYP